MASRTSTVHNEFTHHASKKYTTHSHRRFQQYTTTSHPDFSKLRNEFTPSLPERLQMNSRPRLEAIPVGFTHTHRRCILKWGGRTQANNMSEPLFSFNLDAPHICDLCLKEPAVPRAACSLVRCCCFPGKTLSRGASISDIINQNVPNPSMG